MQRFIRVKTLQKFRAVRPTVRTDFNQVAGSSLAERAGVLGSGAPSPFNHYLGLGAVIGTRRRAFLTRRQAASRTPRTPGSPAVGACSIVLGNGALLL
jgi:hypothetical protein